MCLYFLIFFFLVPHAGTMVGLRISRSSQSYSIQTLGSTFSWFRPQSYCSFCFNLGKGDHFRRKPVSIQNLDLDWLDNELKPLWFNHLSLKIRWHDMKETKKHLFVSAYIRSKALWATLIVRDERTTTLTLQCLFLDFK